MARSIFFGSLVLCVLCIGLSQIPDPRIFGIHDEPERIMFYGGSGVLAGLSGLVAVLSGIYAAVVRFRGIADGQRRFVLTVIWLVLSAVLIAVVIRLYLS